MFSVVIDEVQSVYIQYSFKSLTTVFTCKKKITTNTGMDCKFLVCLSDDVKLFLVRCEQGM